MGKEERSTGKETASKEMEEKLKNTMAERQKQDAELWGREEETSSLLDKKIKHFSHISK